MITRKVIAQAPESLRRLFVHKYRGGPSKRRNVTGTGRSYDPNRTQRCFHNGDQVIQADLPAINPQQKSQHGVTRATRNSKKLQVFFTNEAAFEAASLF